MLNGEEIRKALISWLNYPPETSASLSSLAEHMVRKANQFGAVTAPYYIEMASHIEALEASVERLLTHWDERGGVEKRGSFEGVEYWSPAGRMVDTDFIADLRKTLSQAKE